jgi:hypothetical protein
MMTISGRTQFASLVFAKFWRLNYVFLKWRKLAGRMLPKEAQWQDF